MRVEQDIRFSMVPMWLIESGASTNALALFAILGKFANEHSAWPSRKTLAEMMQASASTVDRALDELRERRAITTVQRTRRDGSQTTNVHLLHIYKPVDEPAELELTAPPSSPMTTPLVTHDEAGSSPMTRGVVTHDDPILELDPRELDPEEPDVEARRAPRKLMDYFKAKWRDRYHDDYVINGPKDSGLARTLLKSKSLDELKRRIDRYLASEDPFFVRARHPFGVYYSAINRLIPDHEPTRYRTPEEIRAEMQRAMDEG